MKKKPLVVLTGPTAVGKTKASIGLAKAIGGEIISADSHASILNTWILVLPRYARKRCRVFLII